MGRLSLGLLACVFACGCGDPELVAGRWVDLDADGVLRNLAVSSDGRVFVASHPGVLRSRNQVSFEAVGERLDVFRVAVDFQDHVYAAVEEFVRSPTPLRISGDGGDTWTAAAVPAGIAVQGIAADPTMPGRVYFYAGGAEDVMGFYRSDNGGASFTKVSTKGGVPAVNGDGTVYLARYDGLWRSDDLGVTFVLHSAEPAGDNLDPRFLLTDPGDIRHLIIGSQDGLYTTIDGGAT